MTSNMAPTAMPSTTAPTMSPTSGTTIITTTELDPPSWLSGINIDLFFVFIFVVLTIRSWIDKKRRGGAGNDTNNINGRSNFAYNGNNFTYNENSDDNNENSIQKLSPQDWIQLYNKTFDSNGNRITLKSEHVVRTSKEKQGKDDDVYDVFDDIELGGYGNNDGNDNGNELDQSSVHLNLDTSESDSSRLSFRRLSSFSNPQQIGGNNSKSKISGTCIICFEDFEPGDEVVWTGGGSNNNENENNNHCKHVFHQECMVQYLASNSHRRFTKKNVKTIENPCPTCRQNFCTVSEDDLAEAIKNKSLDTTRNRNDANAVLDVPEPTETPAPLHVPEGMEASPATTFNTSTDQAV